jgi:drug/metabolite transporter (DMT)-like permease
VYYARAVPRIVAAYLACALIWGTTWYAVRVSFEPGGYPTLLALALRFGIAALLLLPFAIRANAWPKGKVWWWLVAAGVLDAGAYVLVYLGEERIPGGLAAVVYGTQPLILAIMMKALKIQGLKPRHVIGALVSLAGVGVLFLDRLDVSTAQAIGIVLVLGSVIVATSYSVIMKVRGEGVNGLVSTTIFLVVTAVVVGVVALIAREPVTWPPATDSTVAVLYLAVLGTVVAFLVYFWLLGKTTLLVTSSLVFVFPLVALLTDALYERAIPLGPRAYIGAGITLAGLAVSLRRR